MSELTSGFKESTRRNFLRGLAATPAAALASGESLFGQAIKAPSRDTAQTSANSSSAKGKKFVAMQIGARSFVDEGVDKCLDTLQEKGGVNVLMATVFTYGTGLAGRQVHGEPLPDHGVQEYDRVHGGSSGARMSLITDSA
jgi:TAT (twin-arginine translocation) pathway signal sequence